MPGQDTPGVAVHHEAMLRETRRHFHIRVFVTVAALAAGAAFAQGTTTTTTVKNPLDYPVKQYGLILGVSLLGGLVAWGNKVRQGKLHAWNLMALVGELTTAALAGLLCFWACEWAGFAPNLTASLTGLAGYMGTRALAIAEKKAEQHFKVSAPAPLGGDDGPGKS